MTIEAQLTETNKLLALILGVLTPKDVVAATPPPTPAAAPVAAKPAVVKPKPAAVKAAPTPAPVTAPVDDNFDFETPAVDAVAEVKKLTIDDARKALVALQKANSSAEASRGILASNGLASLASLKDEQQELIAKIIADCQAKMPAA